MGGMMYLPLKLFFIVDSNLFYKAQRRAPADCCGAFFGFIFYSRQISVKNSPLAAKGDCYFAALPQQLAPRKIAVRKGAIR